MKNARYSRLNTIIPPPPPHCPQVWPQWPSLLDDLGALRTQLEDFKRRGLWLVCIIGSGGVAFLNSISLNHPDRERSNGVGMNFKRRGLWLVPVNP